MKKKKGISKKIKKLRKEVEEWSKKNPSAGILGALPNRSCWECNSAHKHLKKVDFPIECFICGHIFYKGVKLTFNEEIG